MNLILLVVILVIAIVVALVILYASMKNSMIKNRNSKTILHCVEPGNDAPKLSEMIEYHKNNTIIRYKL